MLDVDKHKHKQYNTIQAIYSYRISFQKEAKLLFWNGFCDPKAEAYPCLLLSSLISSHLVINVMWQFSAVFIFYSLQLMWNDIEVLAFLTTFVKSWSKFQNFWIRGHQAWRKYNL